MSISKDLCKKAIDDLPSRAWGSQTPETLQGVFRGLMHVIEVDGEEVSVCFHFHNSQYGFFKLS